MKNPEDQVKKTKAVKCTSMYREVKHEKPEDQVKKQKSLYVQLCTER